MDTSFNKAFARTVGIEGKYSDNANDSGGNTKYGITERTARAHGYLGDMRELSLDVAKAIYIESYWDAQRLSDVAQISEPVALELFDSGVNLGIEVAGSWFQRALNVLNRQGTDFADIPVDGHLGRVSIAAFQQYMQHRAHMGGERVMLLALNCLQGSDYIEIAEHRPKDKDFVFGWLANRVSL